MPKRKSFYAVAHGRKTGIFWTWDETNEQVSQFPGAVFKGFRDIESAQKYLISREMHPDLERSQEFSSSTFVPYSYNSLTKHELGVRDEKFAVQNDYEEETGSSHEKPLILIDVEEDCSKKRPWSETIENQSSSSSITIDLTGDDTCSDSSRQPSGTYTSAAKMGKTEIDAISPAESKETITTSVESKKEVVPINLDPIQQQAVEAALNGDNIFLTGVAGTGKSLVTKMIVENAKKNEVQVAVAAPTGVAAVNLGLGAQTVHSLAGIRVPQKARDFGTMFASETARRWRKMEMLVIDEIGMLPGDFLDFLDAKVREIRGRSGLPFGGIQLIFVGDFHQLGPVPGRTSLKKEKPFKPDEEGSDCVLGIKECSAYAFQSALWREADFVHLQLKTVFRQDDAAFVNALMDLRQSEADTDAVRNLIAQCSSPLKTRPGLTIPEGIVPTLLYCKNWTVNEENKRKFDALDTLKKTFRAADSVEVSEYVPIAHHSYTERVLWKDKFFIDCQAAEDVELRVSAQVMLISNVAPGYVNGSRGVILEFKQIPVLRPVESDGSGFYREELVAPHDYEKMDGKMFEEIKYGTQLYFDGMTWRVFKFVRYPLVKFMNGTERVITPTTFERSRFRQGTCRRKQIPLRLAWAITVHKSQGMGLDLVVCDLKGCFATGQTYVALSRARTMKGLQIRNFERNRVKSDPLVSGFYKSLSQGSAAMDRFLEEKAGMWWFPILDYPDWLDMFSNTTCSEGMRSSVIFQKWLENYEPGDSYQGWRGFD